MVARPLAVLAQRVSIPPLRRQNCFRLFPNRRAKQIFVSEVANYTVGQDSMLY
jgi:hypothetical protein